MVLQKSSLINRNDFSITCLKCRWKHQVDPSFVESHGRIVKIYGMKGYYLFSCRCGERFNIHLDFRKKPRRKLEVSAFYTALTKGHSEKMPGSEEDTYQTRINSTIKNISSNGVGFTSNSSHNLKPDDELLLRFSLLSGGKEQPVQKRVVVKGISDRYLGCEFFPKDKNDPKIGFYLLDSGLGKLDADDIFY